MKRVRKHLTYANVMAVVLAFILLGDGAWAMSRNSVGTKQLKNGAVTTKKIRNGAITATKIADGAVTGTDIKPTSFDLTVYLKSAPPIGANPFDGSPDLGGDTATCPAGKKAISGGGLSDAGGGNRVYIHESLPVNGTASPDQDGPFNGWRVLWDNRSTSTVHPVVYVVCLG